MTEERVLALVQAALRAEGRAAPAGPLDPLDLDSLAVVALVDALESGLDVRLGPQDVSATHFACVRSLHQLCLRRAVPS